MLFLANTKTKPRIAGLFYSLALLGISSGFNLPVLAAETTTGIPFAVSIEMEFDAVQLDRRSDQIVLTPNGKRATARDWAYDLGIFYSPTIVFFDRKGQEILRIDSVVRLYRLRGVLEYVLTQGYETAPTYQRWRENQQAINTQF